MKKITQSLAAFLVAIYAVIPMMAQESSVHNSLFFGDYAQASPNTLILRQYLDSVQGDTKAIKVFPFTECTQATIVPKSYNWAKQGGIVAWGYKPVFPEFTDEDQRNQILLEHVKMVALQLKQLAVYDVPVVMLCMESDSLCHIGRMAQVMRGLFTVNNVLWSNETAKLTKDVSTPERRVFGACSEPTMLVEESPTGEMNNGIFFNFNQDNNDEGWVACGALEVAVKDQALRASYLGDEMSIEQTKRLRNVCEYTTLVVRIRNRSIANTLRVEWQRDKINQWHHVELPLQMMSPQFETLAFDLSDDEWSGRITKLRIWLNKGSVWGGTEIDYIGFE